MMIFKAFTGGLAALRRRVEANGEAAGPAATGAARAAIWGEPRGAELAEAGLTAPGTQAAAQATPVAVAAARQTRAFHRGVLGSLLPAAPMTCKTIRKTTRTARKPVLAWLSAAPATDNRAAPAPLRAALGSLMRIPALGSLMRMPALGSLLISLTRIPARVPARALLLAVLAVPALLAGAPPQAQAQAQTNAAPVLGQISQVGGTTTVIAPNMDGTFNDDDFPPREVGPAVDTFTRGALDYSDPDHAEGSPEDGFGTSRASRGGVLQGRVGGTSSTRSWETDGSLAGSRGTLTWTILDNPRLPAAARDATRAAWTYTLKYRPASNSTDVFTFRIDDGDHASENRYSNVVTITIMVLAQSNLVLAEASGADKSIVESGGTRNNPATNNRASGSLTLTDDGTALTFGGSNHIAVRAGSGGYRAATGLNNVALRGRYGTLTLTPAGSWTYRLNESIEAAPDALARAQVRALDALDAGDSASDTFTFRATAGTRQSGELPVTITITGANDNPVLGEEAGSADKQVGDGTPANRDTRAFGILTYSDADANDTGIGAANPLGARRAQAGANAPFDQSGTLTGDYGTLTYGHNGVTGTTGRQTMQWEYTLDLTNSAVMDGTATQERLQLCIDDDPSDTARDCDGDPLALNISIVPASGPGVGNPLTIQTATWDQDFSYTIPAGTFTGGNGALTYSFTTQPDISVGTQAANITGWLRLDSSTGAFTSASRTVAGGGTTTAVPDDLLGAVTVTVTATDTRNLSASTDFTLLMQGPRAVSLSHPDPARNSVRVTARRNRGHIGSIGVNLSAGRDRLYFPIGIERTPQYSPTVNFSYLVNKRFYTGRDVEQSQDIGIVRECSGLGGTISVRVNGVRDSSLDLQVPPRPTNAAPTTVNDTLHAEEDARIVRTARVTVTDNDMDPDGDSLYIAGYNTGSGALTNPGRNLRGSYGTLNITSEGVATYTPDDRAGPGTQTDTFTYTVRDCVTANPAQLNGIIDTTPPRTPLTATGNLVVTVIGQDDRVVAQNDTLALDGTDATASVNVLTNTAGADSDPEGAALRVTGYNTGITLDSSPTAAGTAVAGNHGSLTITAAGLATYTTSAATRLRAAGADLNDNFTYRVMAGTGTATATNTAVATLRVTITPDNQAPMASADSLSIAAGAASASVNVLTGAGADSDSRGGTLRVDRYSAGATLASNPTPAGAAVTGTHGELTISGAGVATYIPGPAVLVRSTGATDTFTYRVTDGGLTDTATLTVTITAGPLALAEASGADKSVTEMGDSDASGRLTLSRGGRDIPIGTNNVIGVRVGSSGSFTDVTTGSGNFTGTYGTLHLNGGTGSWLYVLDHDDPDTQALDAGDTPSDSFSFRATVTVEVIDNPYSSPVVHTLQSTVLSVAITVNGADDLLPLALAEAANADKSVQEAGGYGNSGGDASASGSLTLSRGATSFTIGTDAIIEGWVGAIGEFFSVATGSYTLIGTYGTLTLDSDGSWAYALDNADPDTEALDTGATPSDSFRFRARAGAEQSGELTIAITVAGADDLGALPVLLEAPGADKSVSEAGNLAGDPEAGGSLTLTRGTETFTIGTDATIAGRAGSSGSFTSVATGSEDLTGTYGTLTLNSDGSWTYLLNNRDQDTDALNTGDTPSDSFGFRATVGSGAAASQTAVRTITILVFGAADRLVLAEMPGADKEVKEAGRDAMGNPVGDAVAAGSFTLGRGATDFALGSGATIAGRVGSVHVGGAFTDVASGSRTFTGTYGALTLHSDGSWTYLLDNSQVVTDQLVDAGTRIDGTRGTQGATEFFTFRATVGSGSSAEQTGVLTIAITVDGSDDPLRLSEAATPRDKSVTEAGAAGAGDAAAIGDFNLYRGVRGHLGLSTRTIEGRRLGATSWTAGEGIGVYEGAEITGTYGTLALRVSGSWTYELNNDDEDTDALGAGEIGVESFEFRADDRNANGERQTDYLLDPHSNVLRVDILVAGANDAPEVGTAIPAQTVTVGATANLQLPAGALSDVDANDAVTYSHECVNEVGGTTTVTCPAWLSIDASTGALGGTPAATDVGGTAVRMTVTDPDGLAASSDFILNVVTSATQPRVSRPLPDARATWLTSGFSYNVSRAFTNPGGGALTYTASMVPDISTGTTLAGVNGWLDFDAPNGTFNVRRTSSGDTCTTPLGGGATCSSSTNIVPPASANVLGDVTVTITATNPGGESISDSFTLTVGGDNRVRVLQPDAAMNSVDVVVRRGNTAETGTRLSVYVGSGSALRLLDADDEPVTGRDMPITFPTGDAYYLGSTEGAVSVTESFRFARTCSGLGGEVFASASRGFARRGASVIVPAVTNTAPTAAADTLGALPGGSAVAVTVTDNDSDAEDMLTVVGYMTGSGSYNRFNATAAGQDLDGTYGTLNIDAATGVATYTPNAGSSSGTDTFTYRVRDCTVDDPKDLTDVPDDTSINLPRTADTTLTVTVGTDALVLGEASSPAPDKTVTEAGGTDNTPSADSSAGGTLALTNDGAGVTIGSGNTIEGRVEGASAWTAGSGTTPATGAAIAGTYGTLTLESDGDWTYELDEDDPVTDTLPAAESATDSFAFRATVGTGSSAERSNELPITIAITGANDAPRMAVAEGTDNPALTITEGDALDLREAAFVPAFIDVDRGDSLRYSRTVTPAANWFTLSPAGLLSGRAPGGSAGTYTVTVTVRDRGPDRTAGNTDDAPASSSFTLTVLGAPNSAPVLGEVSGADKSVTEAGHGTTGDPSASGSFTFTDEDHLPSNPPQFGTDGTIEGRVGGIAATGDFTPVATGSGMLEGTYGTLTLNSDGSWAYALDNMDDDTNTLAAGASARDTFSFRIDDMETANQHSNILEIVIRITGANDAPAMDAGNALADRGAGEGDTINYMVAAAFTDADEGDTLTYSRTVAPAANWITLTPAGLLAAAPPLGSEGSYRVTITARDRSRAAASDSFTMTVGGIALGLGMGADTSVTEAGGTATTSNPNGVGGDSSASGSIEFNEAGQPVTLGSANPISGRVGSSGNFIAVVTGSRPFTGTYGTLTLNSDGSWAYELDDADSDTDTLAGGAMEEDTFTFRASLGTGSSAERSDVLTIDIAVTGANDAPARNPDYNSGAGLANRSLVEGDPLNYVVADAFTDVDTGDSLTYSSACVDAVGSATTVTCPTWLTSTINGGTVTFGGTSSGVGVTVVRVTATDTGSPALSASDDFTLTVRAANSPPVANDDTLAVIADDPSASVNVLTNSAGMDMDVDNDALTVTGYSYNMDGMEGLGSTPTVPPAGAPNTAGSPVVGGYGSLTITANGLATYTPDDRARALADMAMVTDTFTYRVSDGVTSDTARVQVTVTKQNLIVRPRPDTLLVSENGPAGTINVLTNPAGEDTHVDGDPITVVGYVFAATFPAGGLGATVPPAATPFTNGAAVNGMYGSLTLTASGRATYTPAADAGARLRDDDVTETFSYQVSDGTNTAATTLRVTVLADNDPAVLINDTLNLAHDATATNIDVLTNDSDVDDDLFVLSVTPRGGSAAGSAVALNQGTKTTSANVSGAHGTLAARADGIFAYTISSAAMMTDPDMALIDTFDVAVYQSGDATRSPIPTVVSTLTVNIGRTNQAPAAADDTLAVQADAARASINVLTNTPGVDTDPDNTPASSDGLAVIAYAAGTTLGANPTMPRAAVTGTYGSLTITAVGLATYTPGAAARNIAKGVTETDTFTYEVSDPQDATATAELEVTLTGRNRAPVAMGDTLTVSEDGPARSVNVLTNSAGMDTDGDGDTLTVVGYIAGSSYPADGMGVTAADTALGASGGTAYGSLTITAAGLATYTPDTRAQGLREANGIETFTYQVSDGTATDTATLVVTVSAVNDMPAVGTAFTLPAATEDLLYHFTVPASAFTDVDNAALHYSLTGQPSWLTLSGVNFSGTPRNDDVGTSSTFTLTARDVTDTSRSGAQVSLTVVVNNTNDVPTFVGPAPGPQTATEDTAWTYTFPADIFNDVDVGDTLTYGAILHGAGPNGIESAVPRTESTNFWFTFDPDTRTFNGTPDNDDVGVYVVTLTGSDANSFANLPRTYAETDFTITVANTNDAPVGRPSTLTAQTATQGTPFSYTVPAGTFTDEDMQHGDVLAYSADQADGTALPSWLRFDAVRLRLSGTPAAADVTPSGTPLSLRFTATDRGDDGMVGGNDASASVTLALTVAGLDTMPVVANPIPDMTLIAGTTRMAGMDTNLYTMDDEVTAVTGASPWSYTVPADTFTDADGDSLTLSVTSPATLPSWLSFTAGTGTFSSVNSESMPANLIPDSAADPNMDGVYEGGSVDITLSASDGTNSVTDTFTLTVQGPTATTNTAPVLGEAATPDKSVTEDGDTSAGGSFTIADADVTGTPAFGTNGTIEGRVGNSGSFTAVTSGNQTFTGTYGTLTLNSDGSWTYALSNTDADTNALGAGAMEGDDFSFRIDDGGSANEYSNIVGITITVAGANDAPTEDQGITNPAAITEGGSFLLQVPDDAFADVDSGDTLTYSHSVSPAATWITSSANGQFNGAAPAGSAGSYTVTVTATDSGTATATSTFTLTVNAAPEPVLPLVLADAATPDKSTTEAGHNVAGDTAAMGSLALTRGTTTLNLSRTSGEPQLSYRRGLSSTFTIFDSSGTGTRTLQGDYGTLTLNSDGSWTYALNDTDTDTNTLPAGAMVEDAFSVRAFIQHSATNTETSNILPILIAVAGSNDAPVRDGTLTDQSIDMGDTLSYTFPANTFSDVDTGDGISYTRSCASACPAWLNFNPATRTFSGTASDGMGSHTITVTATDRGGATATAQFTLTVVGTLMLAEATTGVDKSVTEAGINTGGATVGDATASGSLTLSRVRGTTTTTITIGGSANTVQGRVGGDGSGSFISVASGSQTFTGAHGTLTLESDGDWTYALDNSSVDSLAAAAMREDSFSFRIDGGSGSVNRYSNTLPITIAITGSNDAPTLANPIPEQDAMQGAAWTYTFPANVFADVDGNALTYTATLDGAAIPATASATVWLGFDAGTRTFSGTPGNANVGSGTVVVTASDGMGGTITDTFTVRVVGVNDAPMLGEMAGADKAVIEAGHTVTGDASARGSFTFTDPDHGASNPPVFGTDGTIEGTRGTVGSTSVWTAGTGTTPAAGAAIPGTYGTLTLERDGDWTYALDNGGTTPVTEQGMRTNALGVGATEVDVFNFRIDDLETPNRYSGNLAILINVTGSNDAPLVGAMLAPQTVIEGDTLSYMVPDNAFSDPDMDTFTYTHSVSPAATWITLDSSGQFGGAAPAGSVGSYTVTLTATDSGMATASNSFTLTVEEFTRGDCEFETDEDTGLDSDALVCGGTSGADLVVDGYVTGGTYNANTATAAGSDLPGTYGTLSITIGGALTYNPVNNAAAQALAQDAEVTDTFTYRVSNGPVSATAALTITVTGVNDAPLRGTPIPDQSITEGETLSLLVPAGAFSDVDTGDTITYGYSAAPAATWITLNASSGQFGGTAPAGSVGDYTITVSARDSQQGVTTSQFNLDIESLVQRDCTFSTDEDTRLSGENALECNGQSSAGRTVVGYVAGIPTTYDATAATAAGSDLAGTYGTLSIAADGALTYDPTSTAAAQALDERVDRVTDTFTYQVMVGGAAITATLDIRVTGVNDVPMLGEAGSPDTSVTEAGVGAGGTAAVGDATASGTFSHTDVDGDDSGIGNGATIEGLVGRSGGSGGGFTRVATGSQAFTGSYGTLTLTSTGSWSYALDDGGATPATEQGMRTNALAAGAMVEDSFSFRIDDDPLDDMLANKHSNTLVVTIDITGSNDAPFVDEGIDDREIPEGDTLSYTVPGDAFGDVDTGDTLTYSHVCVTAVGSTTTVACPTWLAFNNGTFGGTAPTGSLGDSHVVQVTAADRGADGVAGNADDASVSSQFTLAVVELERMDDDYTTDEDTTLTGVNVLSNDQSAGLVVTGYTSLSTPGSRSAAAGENLPGAHGILRVAANGALTYTPDPRHQALVQDAEVDDIFNYAVDKSGATASAGITITITGVNDAPQPGTPLEALTISVGDSLDLQVPDDAFTDADAGDTLTYTRSANPATGESWITLDMDSGQFGGSAPAGSAGISYTVTVTATDQLSATGSSQFTLTVNAPPVTVADTLIVSEDAGGSVNVRANDIDQEGATLTVIGYAPGATYPTDGSEVLAGDRASGDYGALVITADGDATYTPDQRAQALRDMDATDTFAYQISDGIATATDMLTVTIRAENDAPALNRAIPAQRIPANEVFSLTLDADTFTDPENDTLTYSSDEDLGWLSFDPDTRTFSGTPSVGDTGSTAIPVAVTDGNLRAETEFTLTVYDVLEAPRERNIEMGLSGVARNLGWGTVDTVRGRITATVTEREARGGNLQLALDGTGSLDLARGDALDLSRVGELARQRLRERFMVDATEGDREAHNALAFGANHLDALAFGAPLDVSSSPEAEWLAALGGCGGAGDGGVGDGAFRQPHKSAAPRSSEETLGSEATEGSPEGRKQWQRKAPLTTPPGNCVTSHANSADAWGVGWLPENTRLWVNVNKGELAFGPQDLHFTGDGTTASIGFERVRESGVAGVAISLYNGDFDFEDSAADGLGGEGEFELSQWSLTPYISHATDTARLWGAVGFGVGEMDYSDNYRLGAQESGSADTHTQLAAAGVEFDIATLANLDLVGRAEGMGVLLSADSDQSGFDRFSGQDSEAYGARGEFELGMSFTTPGGSIRPYLTLGYRWDAGGNIEEGAAAEYGGGLNISGPNFTLDAQARTQGSGGSDMELESYAIDLGYDSGGDGMGLTLKLSNKLGGGAGLDPFAERMAYDNFGSSGGGLGGSGGFDASTMDLEAGYGIGARIGAVTGTLRPHASAAFKGGALSQTKLGLSLETAIGRLELLHGLRLAQAATDDEHSVELRLNLNF